MVDKNLKKQFAVYDSDTPVTLKQGQGHQTWYEFLDPKQGHNKAKFFKLCIIIALLGVYGFMPSLMTLTLFQGHRCVRIINCEFFF